MAEDGTTVCLPRVSVNVRVSVNDGEGEGEGEGEVGLLFHAGLSRTVLGRQSSNAWECQIGVRYISDK